MGWVGRVCDNFVVACVFILLIFTPLLFAAVHPITYTTAETLIFLASVAWLLRCLADARVGGHSLGVAHPLPLPTSLLAVMVGFSSLVLLQILSLPEDVRHIFSPRASVLWLEMTRDLPPEAMTGVTFHSTLSLFPFATKVELCKTVSAVALFLLMLAGFWTRSRVSKGLWLVMLMGGAISLLGIAQHLTGTKKIYWFWASEYGGGPFASFPNRNDFAAYVNVALPIGVALFFARWEGEEMARPPLLLKGLDPRYYHRLRNAFSRAIIGVCVGLMATALFMCQSRGGAVGLTVSLFTMTAMLLASQRGRRRLAGLLFLFSGLIFLAIAIAGEGLMERLWSIASERLDRLWIWRDTVKAIADFPIVGAGLGTFMSIFPHYKANPTTSRLINHAHNEYLQLLLETGIVGTFLIILAAALVLGGMVRRAMAPSRPFEWWCTVGVLGGLTGIMATGIFTLCIRIPANTYLTVAVAALGLLCTKLDGQLQNGQTISQATSLHNEVSFWTKSRWRVVILSGGLTLLMGFTLPPSWRAFAAGNALQSARLAEEAREPVIIQLRHLEAAAMWDPSLARAHFEVAKIYEILARSPLLAAKELAPRTPTSAELLATALHSYQKAIAAQPTNAESHSALGLFYWWNPQLPDPQRLARAEAALKRAIYLAPNDERHWINLGEFYESRDERQRAIICYRAAMGIRTNQLPRIVSALVQKKALIEEIEDIIPSDTRCLLTASNILATSGRTTDAQRLANRARQHIQTTDPDLVIQLAWLYIAIGQPTDAVDWLRSCIAAVKSNTNTASRTADKNALSRLRTSLVKALIRTGKKDEALQEARRLVEDHPYIPSHYVLLGEAMENWGDLLGAESQYRRAMRLAPFDFKYVQPLCSLLQREGRRQAAIDVLQDFLGANPECANAHALLASIYAEEKRWDAALSAYDRAIYHEPNNTTWRTARDEVLRKKALEALKKM